MATLITGAGGALGKAVVEAFLANGATVYGVDLAWNQQPHASPNFFPLEANILRPGECERVAKLAAPVDSLVHLVGGFAGGQHVAETTDETWDQMMNMNLRAAFSMFRAVLPQMTAARRGSIVAIASRAGVEPMAGFAAYSVSKAAILALVKTIALEVKDSGITANAVLPSVIDTPANRKAMPTADASKWVAPESIAQLLLWLTSPAARNISGAAIPIYGQA